MDTDTRLKFTQKRNASHADIEAVLSNVERDYGSGVSILARDNIDLVLRRADVYMDGNMDLSSALRLSTIETVLHLVRGTP
jgi:hypothetical protein